MDIIFQTKNKKNFVKTRIISQRLQINNMEDFTIEGKVAIKDNLIFEDDVNSYQSVTLNFERNENKNYSLDYANFFNLEGQQIIQKQFYSQKEQNPQLSEELVSNSAQKICHKPKKEIPERKCSHQSKNLPKNVTKATIKLIIKNQSLTMRMLGELGSRACYRSLCSLLQQEKGKITSIKKLKAFLTTFKYSKEMRVMTQYFMRKKYHQWVFNSKVFNRGGPLRYRTRLQKAIRNPHELNDLK